MKYAFLTMLFLSVMFPFSALAETPSGPWVVGTPNTPACTQEAAGTTVSSVRYCCATAITSFDQANVSNCQIASHASDTCGGNFPTEIRICSVVTPPPATVSPTNTGTTPTTGATQTPPPQAHTNIATFQPIVPIPGLTGPGDNPNFAQYVDRIFGLIIQLGAILAVLMIVYGGFEYMTSAAGITKKDGSDKIRGAVTGLILLLASYLILFVINPCLVKIDLFSPSSGCSVTVQGDAARSMTPPDPNESLHGTYTRTDGSCVALLSGGTCTSGNSPVHKCQNTAETSQYSEPTGETCGTGTQDVYICEASPCGTAPTDVPTGMHVYTADESSCIRDGIRCPTGFENSCRSNTEICLFAGNRFAPAPSGSASCPTTSERRFACTDDVPTN